MKTKLVLFFKVSILVSLSLGFPAIWITANDLVDSKIQLHTTEIARLVLPATVTIYTVNSRGEALKQGSGFFVKTNGLLVTNWHVMKGAVTATVRLSTGIEFNHVMFVTGDSIADFAVLKVNATSVPIVSIDSEIPPIGSEIVAIGSPIGFDHTVTNGIVSAFRRMSDIELVQISAAISEGSSGGPIINSAGKVFAVASLAAIRGNDLNFGIPIRYAMKSISDEAVPKTLRSVFANSNPVNVRENLDWTMAILNEESKELLGTFDAHTTITRKGSYRPEFEKSELSGVLILGRKSGIYYYRTRDVQSFEFAGILLDVVSGSVGKISFSEGRENFVGYKTHAGFSASSSYLTENGEITVQVEAHKRETKYSEINGTYTGELRHWFSCPSVHVKNPLIWFGEAHILQVEDSLFMGLYMRDTNHVERSWFTSGKISREGDVYLLLDTNVILSGVAKLGNVSADWFQSLGYCSTSGFLFLEKRKD